MSKNKDFFSINERTHYNSRFSAKNLNNSAEYYRESLINHNKRWMANPLLQPYTIWHELVLSYTKSEDSILLDYCTGSGEHSTNIQLKLPNNSIHAFDISDKSIEFAKKLGSAFFKNKNSPSYSVQDAHNTSYSNQEFHIVYNFGSLSSLDFSKAINEVSRILKPSGYFISIETFGHNPLTNLKRKINVLFNIRTDWASKNIMTMEKLKIIENTFSEVEVYYFGFFTLATAILPKALIPMTRGILEKIDKLFFTILPFTKKYAFKIVFIAKK